MTATTIKPHPERDGDSHLHPRAYHALAVLAGAIGLSASYVTVQLFALAINATEQEGIARELLTLTAALFVAAELAAMFVAGLVPVRRLRALRWQLIACAAALVAFEAVSLYGARVVLIHATDAQASAAQGRAEALRSRIEANRRNAATLLAAGEFSSRSILPSSRAEGARSIRDAAAMEAGTAHLAAELAQVEAARVPTASAVFGESGVIALAVAQSLLISGIGLLFLGAAGALIRAARDARTALAPMHLTAPTVAVKQTQATPKGTAAAVPNWRRYALPASAIAAGAGLVAMAPGPARAEQMHVQHKAQAAEAPDAGPAQDAPTTLHTSALMTVQVDADDAPMQAGAPAKKTRRAAAPRAAAMRDTGTGEDDGARFLRVKEGIKAGRIKPSLRALYAAEGASQEVARRYLQALEQAGVIEQQGRGYRLAGAAAS